MVWNVLYRVSHLVFPATFELGFINTVSILKIKRLELKEGHHAFTKQKMCALEPGLLTATLFCLGKTIYIIVLTSQVIHLYFSGEFLHHLAKCSN